MSRTADKIEIDLKAAEGLRRCHLDAAAAVDPEIDALTEELAYARGWAITSGFSSLWTDEAIAAVKRAIGAWEDVELGEAGEAYVDIDGWSLTITAEPMAPESEEDEGEEEECA